MSGGTLWRVSIDTRHFSFDAYGATADECRQALQRGIEEHARRVVAEGRGKKESRAWVVDVMRDAAPVEVELGACYRDGSKLCA